MKLQVLSTAIQEAVSKEAPTPSSSEVSDYYDAAKSTQYTTAPTRDVRIVVNKDKAKAEEAKEQLDKDDSAASWKKVAAKFSTDPTTKSTGGLQAGLSEEALQGKEPIYAAIFKSPTGVVVGPLSYEGSYFVVEVEKLNPEKVQTLDEVSSQIKSQLTQQLAQESFSEFVAGYQSKWTSRTFCASGFVIERCANYVGSGHPSSAPAACYEANPKAATRPNARRRSPRPNRRCPAVSPSSNRAANRWRSARGRKASRNPAKARRPCPKASLPAPPAPRRRPANRRSLHRRGQ